MRLAIPLIMLGAFALVANAIPAKVMLADKEAKALAKATEGKVAGKPVSCVPILRGQNLRAIGDHTLIYEASKKRVYRNDLQGACHGLSWGDTLVMDLHGSQYCSGDIARVVNLPSGSQSGSCTLGDFVPYDAPASAK